MRKLSMLSIAGLLLLRPIVIEAQTYYPDHGDLYYDGFYFADSFFWWEFPGGWSVSDPSYEHDFATTPDYFGSCTSSTNLPYGYNDCPTAGQTEEPPYWTFSFGSFHAVNILAFTDYYGSWNFGGGSATTSTFRLEGEEGHHAFCPWDDIWCMGGLRERTLASGFIDWTQPFQVFWDNL